MNPSTNGHGRIHSPAPQGGGVYCSSPEHPLTVQGGVEENLHSKFSVATHAVAVDLVLLTVQGGRVHVRLTKRRDASDAGLWSPPGKPVAPIGRPAGGDIPPTHSPTRDRRVPGQGRGPMAGWALPSARIGPAESVEAAAQGLVTSHTGLARVYLEQLYTFGEPNRDPRGGAISVAYYALVNWDRCRRAPSAPSTGMRWWAVAQLPPLAFDHRRIVSYALERLRNKITYATIGFQLLPPAFTLTELQTLYEIILGRRLDKRNFRRKIRTLGILSATPRFHVNGRQRPARLYRLRSRAPKILDVI